MPQIVGDSGTPVLLLPGGAESVDGFFPGLVEGLLVDPGVRVILHDRPGTGADVSDARLSDAADAIHAVLADLDVGPVVVIGQSLGGAVAALLAVAQPADVAGLVLLDPTPINDPALIAQVASRTKTTVALDRIPVVRALLRGLLRSSARRSANKHGMAPEVRDAMLRVTELDVPQLGRAVVGIEAVAEGFDAAALPRVPAAVVTADRKPGDPVTAAHARLADALGVTAVTWPGAEHAVHLTHPAEVLAVSRDVVRRVDAERG